MKTIGKKFVVLCMACMMVVGVLAGCGPDTSTAAGTLQATLSAMKTGNFQQLSELTGEDFNAGDWEGIPAEDMQRLFRAMFGNISVQVQEKEEEGLHAVVTVKGETGDLSSVIPDVGKEVSSRIMDWYEENTDRALDITSEETRREMMSLMVESFEKYSGSMEKKTVDVEIEMNKGTDSKWIMDSNSAEKMALVVFGSDSILTMQSLLSNLV